MMNNALSRPSGIPGRETITRLLRCTGTFPGLVDFTPSRRDNPLPLYSGTVSRREDSMEVLARTLFPTVVWTTMFDDHEALNERLLQLALDMRTQDERGVQNTNIFGWQSPNTLQNLEEFSEFNQRVLQLAREIGESLNYKQDAMYHLEAWININPPGAYNEVHVHPNCHLSGCYYVRLTPDCGRIYFRDPRTMGVMMKAPITKETHFSAGQVRMRAEEGRAFVFPSWLEHGVEPNLGEGERVSIAFNVHVAPKGSRHIPGDAY